MTRALTHSSTNKANNEQLEFLGDRVLGLLIAELLMQQFPEEREGPLSRRLHTLVNKETCAKVALEAGLDKHLILEISLDRAGGRSRAAILGDVCEAVIAAVYLDGGLKAARNFVVRYWRKHFDSVPPERDGKSMVQDWVQARGLALPSYKIVKSEGPSHAPHFTVELAVEGHEPAHGEGPNLRVAEQAAARAFLQRLKV